MSESSSGSAREDESLPLEDIESLLETLHRTPPAFEDERMAPPLDRERLRLLARHELDQETARPLFVLIHRFQSWRDTFKALLIEEFHRSEGNDAI